MDGFSTCGTPSALATSLLQRETGSSVISTMSGMSSAASEPSTAITSPRGSVSEVRIAGFREIPSMFNDHRYSDLTIYTRSDPIHVHRAIVCQNSTVLDAWCDAHRDQNVYTIKQFHGEAVHCVFSFLYSGRLTQCRTRPLELQVLACAADLGISALVKACLAHLSNADEGTSMAEMLVEVSLEVSGSEYVSFENFVVGLSKAGLGSDVLEEWMRITMEKSPWLAMEVFKVLIRHCQ